VKHNQLFMISLAAGAAMVASAQTPAPQFKVGVIQIQQAMVSTRDGQKAVGDLNARMAPKQKELERKQLDIKDLQDKLQKGGDKLADTARVDLQRSIDSKTKIFNRDMEDAQAEMDSEQRKVLDELTGKMTQVIDKFAVANGYAVILDVSNPNTPVLYASTAVDITKEIIDLYDKSNPSAPGSKPPPTGAAKPAPTGQATPTNPAAPKPTPTSNTPPVKKQP
jgi:outer membrane protein